MLAKVRLLAREMLNVFRQMPTSIALKYAGAVLWESPQIMARRSLDPADQHMTSVRLNKFGRWYTFDEIPFALIRELYPGSVKRISPGIRKSSINHKDIGNMGLFSSSPTR